MLRPAVQGALLPGVTIESEFGGDDHFVAEWGEGFADEFLVREGAIDLGSVEKSDALFNGRTDDGDHFLFVPGRAVAKAHAHAAEAKGRDFEITVTKFAFLHCLSFFV